MKKQASPKTPRNLDKHLFEAGQQCHKRLWLDFHQPVEDESGSSRKAMSVTGQQLLALARSVFPKGVQIEGATTAKAAEATAEQLAAGTPVLFGATFVAEGVETRCDILVRHKDGAIDLYEVKSGTKIKHRYVNDLAMQMLTAERCGHRVRAAFLLHLNPKYAHKEGADFPPMQLLRSADVTTKVKKQIGLVTRRLAQFRQVLDDESVLELPMGTFCTLPFPCPHIATCRKKAPALPLFELPELTRALELELHKEGIEDLNGLDPERPNLTFRQRRLLACVRQGTPIVETFVRDELGQAKKPLHFLALATVTEALPRFDGQRPWRQMPFAWAANTIHADGRLEAASFVHVDRTDPRPEFAATLGKHLDCGGTIVCWNDEALDELHALLEDLPTAKAAVRSITQRQTFDMMQLFEAGVFHPALRNHLDLRSSVAALLEDSSGNDLAVWGEDTLRDALAKATAPRVRSTTKDKVAADVKATVQWIADRLLQLFRKFGEGETPKAAPPAPKPSAASKGKPRPLPKPLA
ncbi:MAG: DUF2779 domain-containing protein [Planctomycetes bacterium]|nr:DUF2779 domain-containing protein [Planctomycetota bacterium]